MVQPYNIHMSYIAYVTCLSDIYSIMWKNTNSVQNVFVCVCVHVRVWCNSSSSVKSLQSFSNCLGALE